MVQPPIRVTLTELQIAGSHITAQLRAPDTSIHGLRQRNGGRPMTAEGRDERFGHIPSVGQA